jgi:hypothetical protein
MSKWLKNHGLLLTNAALFLIFFVGMVLTGVNAYNHDEIEHGGDMVSLAGYLLTGDFLEATFENWESEFLQMGMYVVLTAYLFQKGSSESKNPGQYEPVDEDPRKSESKADAPWPVRRGGWVLKIYEHSLSGLFFLLFFASVALHAVGGARAYSAEQLDHGQAAVSTLEYVGTSQFWFESFQNWQSEFMVIAVMIGASIFLRERGSVESKPVAMPHDRTDA